MATTADLDVCHHKICTKFDCLESIARCLQLPSHIEPLYILYTDSVSGILARYYQSPPTSSDLLKIEYDKILLANNIQENMEVEYEKLIAFVANSESSKTPTSQPPTNSPLPISDLSTLALELEKYLQKIPVSPSSPRRSESIEYYKKLYNENHLIIRIPKQRINICQICNSSMTLFPDTSELVCDEPSCKQLILLQGILFEDSQFYNQSAMCTKSKKYDPNGHLSKWIDKIQAKEDHIFTPPVIAKIDEMAIAEYTRDMRLRSMANIKCEKIREWLQKYKYTDCYDHAPLLRKIITGMHGPSVIPPELTPEERLEILIECSLSLREFENVIRKPEVLHRLEKEKVLNKFYYPYILWQIINLRVSDPIKKRKLLECIHLQSDNTLRRNDIIWKEICKIRDYKYYTATRV